MSNTGQDVLDVGLTRVGQKYILGARVPLNNPNWKGPWDCAEFTSWCAYQAYGQIFGAGNPARMDKAEPYSGHWYSEAKTKGKVITWQDALKIPGAVLIRAPAAGRIGHVAFSMGDNDRTLEARGAAFGVGIFSGATERPWSMGCLLPGVEYALNAVQPQVLTTTVPPVPLPDGYMWLKVPALKGAAVIALQKALKAKGIDSGPIDGVFGSMTAAAVSALQAIRGLEVDGVVGPKTAAALGLSFPVSSSDSDQHAFARAQQPQGPGPIALPAAAGGIDLVVDIVQKEQSFYATTASGFTFMVGTATHFTDDMNRTGLFQGSRAIRDSLNAFGEYQADHFVASFGKWAHFIEPTLKAEGGGRFATLNTYDRAAFTFGAPQFAAHTPGANLILYLRALVQLPGAKQHFPELSLRDNAAGGRTLHLNNRGNFVDLEEASVVTRPNGKKETQLAALMKYLNNSSTEIDAAELSAAARLMNWLRTDPQAKALQIGLFIETAKQKLDKAKLKVHGFSGNDWHTALWIMDILHQGRGRYDEIATALLASDAQVALKKIGWPTYKARIKTVEAAVQALDSGGKLRGFTV
ncbi:peptidoglycan-binding domain-containing protein [Pseudomonas guariconensis]|uniref:peptidoglycan-binding domain-containing protein n=1 Tax=Pseudomonas guariconensis TaxID=1288410 RepID=UPI0018A9147E|nr:peptidoglycan-binding protein [Pseudomonas guariconensis]MBF8753629.1 peptidoglycan-binding protein [Pseudomonas guariconensis]